MHSSTSKRNKYCGEDDDRRPGGPSVSPQGLQHSSHFQFQDVLLAANLVVDR